MGATTDAAGAQAGAIALLWDRPATPRRGPKPTLNLEAIAQAGIGIADADGLSAVTMQRVAAAVGVTKMALYRYVPGKAELVALMIDIGIGEAPRSGGAAGDWRPRLDQWARQMFSRFWRHPWALEVTVGPRAIGPNELGWIEEAVAALAGTGLDGGEMLDVAATLAGHVRAIVQQRSAPADGRPEQAMEAAITGLLRGRQERFPALTAALGPGTERGSQDKAFDFGLARILDGVGLLIASRTKSLLDAPGD
jgi:AcrR family transcriptional regulator